MITWTIPEIAAGHIGDAHLPAVGSRRTRRSGRRSRTTSPLSRRASPATSVARRRALPSTRQRDPHQRRRGARHRQVRQRRRRRRGPDRHVHGRPDVAGRFDVARRHHHRPAARRHDARQRRRVVHVRARRHARRWTTLAAVHRHRGQHPLRVATSSSSARSAPPQTWQLDLHRHDDRVIRRRGRRSDRHAPRQPRRGPLQPDPAPRWRRAQPGPPDRLRRRRRRRRGGDVQPAGDRHRQGGPDAQHGGPVADRHHLHGDVDQQRRRRTPPTSPSPTPARPAAGCRSARSRLRRSPAPPTPRPPARSPWPSSPPAGRGSSPTESIGAAGSPSWPSTATIDNTATVTGYRDPANHLYTSGVADVADRDGRAARGDRAQGAPVGVADRRHRRRDDHLPRDADATSGDAHRLQHRRDRRAPTSRHARCPARAPAA